MDPTKMEPVLIDPSTLDQKKVDAFVERLVGDMGATAAIFIAGFGDRLGLFKALHGRPATSTELAKATGLDERYVREWLNGAAAAGYVTRKASGTFHLTPEQAYVLAQEGGPVSLGGAIEDIIGATRQYDGVAEAFRTGLGVPPSQYTEDFWRGIERFTQSWFENLLLQDWLPRVPHVQTKLEAGAAYADVGCGRGRALVKLAKAFPKSRFVGIDAHAPSLEAARQHAEAEGVADRVTFVLGDAATGLPQSFDVVALFDVLHDTADPKGVLRAIREALKPDGTLLVLEIKASDDPTENNGPIASLFYGISLLYCMTSSLASGGAGLGTLGVTPNVAKRLFAETGYKASRLIDLGNPFNVLFEAQA